MQCFSCDYEGTRRGLGSHYGSKPDHRPKLSKEQREIITGLLMGDGHINRSATTPRLRAEMTNKEYLDYLDRQFPHIGSGVTKSRTASEQSESHIESGFNENATADSYSDCYWWETMAHQELSKYAEWYETGQKVFPEGINITPTILKHWYVCDGSIRNEKRMVLYLDNESRNQHKIESYFSELVDSVYWESVDNHTAIRFSTSDSKSLFEYMGKPLPGFQYKWPPKDLSRGRTNK